MQQRLSEEKERLRKEHEQALQAFRQTLDKDTAEQKTQLQSSADAQLANLEQQVGGGGGRGLLKKLEITTVKGIESR